MTNKERKSRLSSLAAATLAGMSSSKIGAVVPAATLAAMNGKGPAVLAELRKLDIIGGNDGLTIKGSAVACVLQSELLDRMFG